MMAPERENPLPCNAPRMTPASGVMASMGSSTMKMERCARAFRAAVMVAVMGQAFFARRSRRSCSIIPDRDMPCEKACLRAAMKTESVSVMFRAFLFGRLFLIVNVCVALMSCAFFAVFVRTPIK